MKNRDYWKSMQIQSSLEFEFVHFYFDFFILLAHSQQLFLNSYILGQNVYCYWPNLDIQSEFVAQACPHLSITSPLFYWSPMGALLEPYWSSIGFLSLDNGSLLCGNLRPLVPRTYGCPQLVTGCQYKRRRHQCSSSW